MQKHLGARIGEFEVEAGSFGRGMFTKAYAEIYVADYLTKGVEEL